MGPCETALIEAHRSRRARMWAAAYVPPVQLEQVEDAAPVQPKEPEGPCPSNLSAVVFKGRLYLAHDVQEPPREIRSIPIRSIIGAVASDYNVPVIDVLSHRRTAGVVRPRQVGMYLAKKLTTRSLPEIGRMFGGKDHTTVLHAVRKVEKLMAADPDLVALVERLEARVSQA